jgi:hypothetical protein
MDKNFNEDELSDIMKEIEALEENLQIEEAMPKATPVMEQLSKMDEAVAIPKAEVPRKEPVKVEPKATFEEEPEAEPEAEVYKMSAAPKNKSLSNAAAPASMSFKVSGEMHLELQFEVSGHFVNLEIDESGLNIRMEGGATFKVPLKKAA